MNLKNQTSRSVHTFNNQTFSVPFIKLLNKKSLRLSFFAYPYLRLFKTSYLLSFAFRSFPLLMLCHKVYHVVVNHTRTCIKTKTTSIKINITISRNIAHQTTVVIILINNLHHHHVRRSSENRRDRSRNGTNSKKQSHQLSSWHPQSQIGQIAIGIVEWSRRQRCWDQKCRTGV